MKKLLCAVLVVVMVLSLAACGNKLKGTYKSEEKFGAYVTYTFDGDKVTFAAYAPLVGKVMEVSGTYEINKDTNEITFTYGESEDTGDAPTGTVSFEKGDGYIKIGGTKLIPQE